MSVTEYLLDGLAAYLELERELGVRVVECDKSLLAGDGDAAGRGRGVPAASAKVGDVHSDAAGTPRLQDNAHPNLQPSTSPSTSHSPSPSTSSLLHFVFLHDRPLSPAGVEMMSKIIVALGETADSAPIIIEKPVPKVPIYVVLGGRALAKFLPGRKAGPGDWIKSEGGRDVLVTYSPEYILRFDGVSETTKQIKQSMWRSLKAVKQRLG